MKKTLLILLTVLFIGCSKDNESENGRIAGKWVLSSYTHADGTREDDFFRLMDEFCDDGTYFGYLPNGIDKRDYATYSLKENALTVKGRIEVKFKVDYLDYSTLIITDINHEVGAEYVYNRL